MTKLNKRVSIVIATKDRYETLFDCIRGLLINYDNDKCEIVVRDNSSSPRSEEFLAEFNTYRSVVYSANSSPVSQSENCETAVALASGEFITLIGDDDCVASGLIRIADWMDELCIDSFFPGFSTYFWPGVSARLSSSNDTGHLNIAPISPPHIVCAESQRKAVLASGGTSLEKLPRLYYGLTRRSCLDHLKAVAGKCFPGPSPDMANAFALSYIVKKFVVAELPIFIAGNSRKSAAGLGLRGKHVGEINELPFLPTNTAQNWNSSIPFFWSGQTIWCQSAFAAATSMGHAVEFERENAFRVLYARALVYHPFYSARTLRAFLTRHTMPMDVFVELVIVIFKVSDLFARRIGNFIRNRLSPRSREIEGVESTPELPSVVDATKYVDRFMHTLNMDSFLDVCIKNKNRNDGDGEQ